MTRLTSVAVTQLAGYQELVWDRIEPNQNILIGRNGAGKSTLLEAIAVGLNFVHGKHSGDLLTGANLAAHLHFTFSDGRSITKTLGEIRTTKTPVGGRPVDNVLYVNEARRPKSRFGKPGRNYLTQHPTRRYEYVLSELQHRLRGSDVERRWMQSFLAEAAGVRNAWHDREWAWITKQLPQGTQGAPRPMSCGQYDTLSLLLDLVRTAEAAAESGQPISIILDNPDGMLHPALQTELLKVIRRLLPQAQCFIGTHSLSLVASADPISLSWLSRDHTDAHGRVHVQRVRDLSPDGRGVFFDLYGQDTTSAVLATALGLQSTEYFTFLCASAFPCRAITRSEPIEADPQIQEVLEELRGFRGRWTLVDVGAGAGDLLIGARRLGLANPQWEYVAVEPEIAVDTLTVRIRQAIEDDQIAPTSRVVSETSLPACCDAVVFVNTCHALGVAPLAGWLATGLGALQPAARSRLVIHEAEVLQHGEHTFIMWTPEEYLALFAAIPGLDAEEVAAPPRSGVPIHTVVVRRDPEIQLPDDLADRLRAGLEAMLAPKLERIQQERRTLESVGGPVGQLAEAVRSRRRAFFTEQIANILDELSRLSAASTSTTYARGLDENRGQRRVS